MRYHMTNSSEGRSLIVLVDEYGDTALINESHPNYLRIAQAVRNGEEPADWLLMSSDWFESEYLDEPYDDDDDWDIDDEDGDGDYFDRTAVESVRPVAVEGLRDTIERYRREGKDATNLVAFMVLLSKNPSNRSQEQLFQWSNDKGLTIDTEGYIIAYKSVTADMLSHTSGTALVDGVEISGQIPNLVGSVVTMPRHKVADDFRVGCSTGLHVGSYSYASTFGRGGVLLEVRVDPADVVSVPEDCSYQKMRVCRYTVIAVHDSPEDDLSAYEPEGDWDEEEAWDDFVNAAPTGFIDAIKARVRNLGRNK